MMRSKAFQPARQLYELVRAMFVDIWDMKLAEAHNAKKTLNAQIKDVEEQTDALLDRIVEASSPAVITPMKRGSKNWSVRRSDCTSRPNK
jgi:hypothetical protein